MRSIGRSLRHLAAIFAAIALLAAITTQSFAQWSGSSTQASEEITVGVNYADANALESTGEGLDLKTFSIDFDGANAFNTYFCFAFSNILEQDTELRLSIAIETDATTTANCQVELKRYQTDENGIVPDPNLFFDQQTAQANLTDSTEAVAVFSVTIEAMSNYFAYSVELNSVNDFAASVTISLSIVTTP